MHRHLQQHGVEGEYHRVSSNSELYSALDKRWDIVLSDYNLPGMDFLAVLQHIRAHYSDLPVILVSGSIGEENAVSLLKLGLSDFVLKSNLSRLPSALFRALEEVKERNARQVAEKALLASQTALLEAQQHARLAALNLMEDALAARDRAEAALAALSESENKYRLLAENATDCIFWLDHEGYFKYLSPTCEQLFGYSVSEFLADPKLMTELIHPLDRNLYQQYLKDCMDADMGELQLRIEHKNGSIQWISHHCKPIIDVRGQFSGLQGAIRSITQQKESEQQLRKLAQAVEQSPESIIITNTKGEIEYVNEAFTQNTGYAVEEVVGLKPNILKSGRTPPEIYIALRTALLAEQTWKGNFYNKRKDGSEYIDFAIITPIRQADGSISHYLAVQEDITEKTRIADELEQHRHHLEELISSRTSELIAARLLADSANQAKSVFLANMSHEIRTPMNAIIGLAYLLQKTGLTHKQKRYLEQIDTSAQHLMAIINDILDLSKIEANRMELEKTNFSLETLFDHIFSLLSNQAQSKGLSIVIDREGVPTWLRGDPTRLLQALLNYMSNAIKFTQRGTIWLRAKLLEESGSKLLVRFEVQDTGLGIDLNKQSTLFTAFTQADVSTTRQYGGTGLGLAITSRLANLMGGLAGVDSVLGEGSLFWFTAWLQNGQCILSSEDSKKPLDVECVLREHHSGARLLLVDDNTINQEVALELLHRVGLTVDTAENGFVAVNKVTSCSYDLVLMDMQMPVMDGVEATKLIRTLPGFDQIPIIAMTANVFEEVRQACLDVGMNDFVLKPVKPMELYNVLLRWLSSPYQYHSAPWEGLPLPILDATLSETSTDIPAQLMVIRGLNVVQGLGVVHNDVKKYCRLLRLFVKAHSDDMKQVEICLSKGDIKGAQNLTHRLKGVAATLSIVSVSEIAAQLDMTFYLDSAVDECIKLARQCDVELSKLAEAILLNIPEDFEHVNAPPIAINYEDSSQIIAELKILLSENNIRAGKLALESADLLRSRLGSDYESFIQLLNGYDFDGALKTLQELTSKGIDS